MPRASLAVKVPRVDLLPTALYCSKVVASPRGAAPDAPLGHLGVAASSAFAPSTLFVLTAQAPQAADVP